MSSGFNTPVRPIRSITSNVPNTPLRPVRPRQLEIIEGNRRNLITSFEEADPNYVPLPPTPVKYACPPKKYSD